MKYSEDIARLQDAHLDAMIKLAFDLDDAETTRRLLESPDPELTPDEERLADEILALALIRAEKEQKRSRQHDFARTARKVLPWIINTAACIILLLAMAAPIALANSATFRSKVLQLIMELDEEKGEAYFSLVQDEDASFDVPEGWEGYFFPAYIPEGFTIFEYPEEFFTSNIGYSNEAGSTLYFDEYNESVGKTSDTGSRNIDFVDINGSIGYMIYSSQSVDLTWEKDGRVLCITAYGLSTDEALQVARSVRRIVK